MCCVSLWIAGTLSRTHSAGTHDYMYMPPSDCDSGNYRPWHLSPVFVHMMW